MSQRTKQTKDLAPVLPVSKELLDQLVTGPMTPVQFETMFRGLNKAVLERALGAESLLDHKRLLVGAGSRNRTHDQRFTKPLLYP